MNTIITITTDFGDQFAAAQLKAVIASLGFTGNVVENHSVAPYSILEGAFELEILSRYTCNGGIHVCVIDPGVGTNRWGIIIKTKRSYLIGPNNGVLYPLAIKEGIKKVWKINESAFGSVSTTFHGRDVFIKSAVFLAQGILPESFGAKLAQKNSVEKFMFRHGQIVHIDDYGNYKVYWNEKVTVGTRIKIEHNKRIYTIPIVKTFNDVLPSRPLALLGSSGTLEIAVNLGSAQDTFQFALGDVIRITKIPRE